MDNAQMAIRLIQQKRQDLERNGALSTKGLPLAPIGAFTGTKKRIIDNSPKPTVEVFTAQQAKDFFALTSIDDLETSHMNKAQAERFYRLISDVRLWRSRLDDIPARDVKGRLLILSSKENGLGKTHIAHAVCASFAKIACPAGEQYAVTRSERYGMTPNFSLSIGGKVVKVASLFKKTWDQGDEVQKLIGDLRFIGLDDVGREGIMPFEKRDMASQTDAKQDRYFQLIDTIYEKCVVYGRPVNLLITTNLSWDELSDPNGLFNKATWSRIEAMCPRGNFIEIGGVPSYRNLLGGRYPDPVPSQVETEIPF